MTRIVFVALSVVVGLLGCRTTLAPDTITDTGTVLFMSFEGGFFGIADDHGRHWDPSNLPAEFEADSLRVRFEAEITDLPSYHMWGRTVDLVSITRLE